MKSKLSLHIMNWDPVDVTNQWLEHVRPPLFKVMDIGLTDNKVEDARRFLAQGGIVIGRAALETEDYRPPVPSDEKLATYNPRAAAQEIFERMRPEMDKMGWRVDVWESINEFPVDEDRRDLDERDWKKARLYSDFTVELAELVRRAGRDYAAYSFSTGNPNHLEIWKALEPGVMASKYLALHEYIEPGKDYRSPNYSQCKRHQEVYRVLSPQARAHVKMLITECGADLGGVPGKDGGGFKKQVTDEMYWQWLHDYDKILMGDPYVVGATIYTYGHSGRWDTYDIVGSTAKILMNEIAKLPEVEAPTVPVVTTPPPVTIPQETKPPVETKPSAEVLPLAKARWFVEEALRQLEAKNADAAHKIMTETVIDWFYDTARENSTDLKNAKAHAAARWWCEEAARKIEQKNLTEAHAILRDHVLTWLNSKGPAAIGILSVEYPSKPKPKTKPTASTKKLKKKATTNKASAKKAQAKKPATKKSRRTKPKTMLLSAE